MKDKKGFTLVELLAVIIILGILLLVAIPTVTKYINDSRKGVYVDTAKQYIQGASKLINGGDIGFYDPDSTLYVPTSCVALEQGGYSPYGKFNPAYIVVTYGEDGYDYYWTSRDEAEMGFYLTYEDSIDADSIKSNIKEINTDVSVGDRRTIKVMKDTCDINDLDEIKPSSYIKEGGSLSSYDPEDPNNTSMISNRLYLVIKQLYEKKDKSVLKYDGRVTDTLGSSVNASNIYYYNSNSNNSYKPKNNVLFADNCWQVIRTTEDKGVKLIYNGLPEDGECNKSGENDTLRGITTAKFNVNNNGSLSRCGYMYNKDYPMDYLYHAFDYNTLGMVPNYYFYDEKYFSDSYEYNNGQYTLVNPQKYDRSNPNILIGKYTSISSDTGPNNKIYYVFGADRTNIYYMPYEHGKTLEQAENDFNISYKFGSSVEKNEDGTYTINGPYITVKVMDYYNSSSVRSSINFMYTCNSMGTKCSNVYEVYYTGYKEDITTYRTGNYVFGNSVSYDTVSKKYTLTNTISTYDTVRASNFNNYHYTCFNESGKCETVNYLVYSSAWWEPYGIIRLSNGKTMDDALYEMGYHSNDYDVDSYVNRYGSYKINQDNSIAKATIENWFSNNMTQYSSYLNDTVYCNSRVFLSPTYYNPNGGNINSQVSYFENNSLECFKETDQFTTNNQKAKLNYPVGLVTYKEQILSGKFTHNAMGMDSTYVQYDYIHNGYGYNEIDDNLIVRPVITLKPTINVLQGDGSTDNPFIID